MIVARWAPARSAWFVLNLLLVALLVWLVAPLFEHRSASPALFGRYSLPYAGYLGMWVVMAVTYLVTAALGDREINRNLFVSALVVLTGAEIAARWRGLGGYYAAQADPLRYPVPFLHFIGQPNATFAGPPRMGGTEEERRITLNAIGLRGDIPVMPKNEYRVIVLGGSTAFNGAPLGKSIPGYLQELLQRTRSNTRVYNWGVTSFNSGQELTLLTHLAGQYEPDLVVVYDGINDIIIPYVYDPRPGYPYDWLITETGLRMVRGSAAPNTWAASLLLWSRLATALFRDSLVTRLTNIDSLRAQVGYGSEKWRREIASEYLTNLRTMCAVSRGFRARFAAFLQPSVFTKRPLVGGEPVMLDTAAVQMHVGELYQALRVGLRDLGSVTSECTFHDVSDALEGVSEQLYWDFAHVTNEGNQRISQRIYEMLESSN